MAAKKYYAVRRGKKIGIFESWEACKESVDGYPGAEYKGFSAYEEACAYLGTLEIDLKPEKTLKLPSVELPEGKLLVYVDGSYNDALKKYAFGCVFLPGGERVYTRFGNGDNPQSLQHRNVTGEMLGAMYAVRVAMCSGYREVEICYDYEGIEKWVTGQWRSKTELTGKYAEAMREWGSKIRITFTKVAAHTNVAYNELADNIAKKGLTEGNGVPAVGKLEEMDRYDG